MDLNFGHGFIPRVGADNYLAVDRCAGPATLLDEALDLPWAIIDGAWAEPKPELLATLRQHGTQILVDTDSWRYRYETSFGVEKLRSASWAPSGPVGLHDASAVRDFVRASLKGQADLDADAYLVPGWLPESADEDLRDAYATILETAGSFDEVDPKPLVLFVGGHTRGLTQVVALLDTLPHFVSALYVQLSPIAPAKDGPSKLERMTEVYHHAASLGFKVIAGHAGAVEPQLRALGIDAADAGLATAETFDRSRARRQLSRGDDASSRGGRRARMYLSQLGRSLGADDIERTLRIEAAAAQLRTCRLPCHRFRPDHLLDRAREHSLWARIEEARLVASLPATMRSTSVEERMRQQRSVLSAINGALEADGQPPLDVRPIDNQLAWLLRATAISRAA